MEYDFGESLRNLLNENGLTPQKFAEIMNFSKTTVYSWLGNKADIKLSSLLSIAEYFGCSVEFLIGRSDENIKKNFKKCPPFAESFRDAMKESGITTYKLMKTTRFGGEHLFKWAHGTDPLLSTLVDLSDIFDCTVDRLIGRE